MKNLESTRLHLRRQRARLRHHLLVVGPADPAVTEVRAHLEEAHVDRPHHGHELEDREDEQGGQQEQPGDQPGLDPGPPATSRADASASIASATSAHSS